MAWGTHNPCCDTSIPARQAAVLLNEGPRSQPGRDVHVCAGFCGVFLLGAVGPCTFCIPLQAKMFRQGNVPDQEDTDSEDGAEGN